MCTSACGNGWVEGSEVCDDNNTVACGQSNATCDAVNATVTGCANGVECSADADCTSANCVAGVCRP